MTKTTRERIRAYKAALPGLRERVIAVALLLAMSVAMMASASFAWLTISRRPAVTGVSTTLAANGNLEIALATGNGTQAPGASQVGDSSAAEGQTIPNANITWGNLINLSDASYGLENLTLRPAQLNTASLLESPLYGAIYGSDGRITQLSSNFGYAKWTPAQGNTPGYFGVSDEHGVRAISSTKIQAVGAEALYVNMVTEARNTNLAAANAYVALGNNDKYMPSLATMMGLYMTARMNPSHETLSNPDCQIEDIQNLRDMYAAFLDAFDMEAEAMARIINLQLFLEKGEGNYDPWDAEDIYATTDAKLKAAGMQISDFTQFLKDHTTIVTDLEKLKTICSSGTSLKWKDSGLNDIVNNLVNVGACTIGADNTPISSIGASNAMGYLSGTQEARITNGILYRFEERTGGYIRVKDLGISATVNRGFGDIPATVKANIQTTAPRNYNLFTNDLAYAQSKNDGNYKGGIPVAEDTYGLAVDFWVRTNATGAYLTLEGNVLSYSEDVRATGKDANGNTVELYIAKMTGTDDEGNPYVYDWDLYKVGDKWHSAETHTELTDEDLQGAEILPKMETITTVTGFEGENRVWGDNELMSVDSTTQGSGSCYVYYADTPEDQARSLKLLEAFNVAFVNAAGELVASAYMDTERHYAANGRVIVPLVLNSSDSIDLGEDYNGNTTYAIAALEKNVPTRMTAIVYLDGTKLTNQEVLAASDIQGQLNIQFGSTQTMEPIANEKLEGAERRVSATVDKTSFDYDTATEPMKVRVTVTVDGEEATTVSAFFIRAISATQGSREDVPMIFQPAGNGQWTAEYTFTAPGNYVLRTVQLDGVDYDLQTTPQVSISGFAVESLTCEQAEDNHISIMTAADMGAVDMLLKFATDDEAKMPTTVQGRFLRDSDGAAVNIPFIYNATTQNWTGTATFVTSGDYTLQYLVINGKYEELPAALQQTASVTLGMRVAVYTTSPHSFKFIPSEMTDNQKLLAMQVKIFDNAGKEMNGLSGAKLTYTMKGSGVKKMDTDLEWDGRYYVGELTTTGPGIWQFGNVELGANILTNANTYPTFTILSPEPPEYHAHSTSTYQYRPGKDAQMNVQITNSAAATVQAQIVKSDGTAKWVNGTIGGEYTTSDNKTVNNWNFLVPTDANGNQDGNWTLKQLRLWDVFAADGTAYTEEAPLIFDVSDTNNKTKVVTRIFVTFPEGKSADFGKDATGKVTGVFMQEHTVSGLYVDIHDFENAPISGISDVQLAYVYGNNSSTYGGYTSTALTNALADFTIVLADDGSGTRFAQSGVYTMRYAGSYATTFSFKVNGVPFTFTGSSLPANTPVFSVSSVPAKLTITGTSAYTDFSSGAASSNTANSATVYFQRTASSGTGYDWRNPSVKIKLEGYGSASGASLAFTSDKESGEVLIYTTANIARNSMVNNYTWTGDGEVTRYIGFWKSQSCEDDHEPAGTLTSGDLVFTYGGNSYVFDLDPQIVITNIR